MSTANLTFDTAGFPEPTIASPMIAVAIGTFILLLMGSIIAVHITFAGKIKKDNIWN